MGIYGNSVVEFTTELSNSHTKWKGGTCSVAADTSANLVTVALSNHQNAFVTFVFAATDRCCHSGGSGYIECHLDSNYGSPGLIVTENIIPGQWTDLDFFPYAIPGSRNRALRVTNNDGSYGTSTLQCYAIVQSSGAGVTYAF